MEQVTLFIQSVSFIVLNRARSFSENIRIGLGEKNIPIWVEQFAENVIHTTYTPKNFTFYEDPYAFAGLGSDITHVSPIYSPIYFCSPYCI